MEMKKKISSALSVLSPVLATKIKFFMNFHRRLDLNSPKTLDEKIQWLKLNFYRDNPLVSKCADKYRVREYVQDCGCSEILNELLFVWDKPEDVDWEALPKAFVIKCNHGCGYNLLCPDQDKLDLVQAKKQLTEWYNEDYWKISAEIQYKPIPKKLICEKFIGDGKELIDYKIYCFDGVARYVMVCVGREYGTPKFYFFDRDWNFCPLTKDGRQAPKDFYIEKPQNYDRMIRYADILSAPFPFVRTDLYDVDGHILFGELTFTPASGFDKNRLPETDRLFGGLLDIGSLQIPAYRKRTHF